MPKFVAIIGGRNAGKSTIIKSLTGCRTSAFRGLVEDNLTKQSVYVVCSSPQELAFSIQKLKRILQFVASKSGCQGVVMAIQPNQPTKRLSMESIFREVTAFGNFTVHAFIVDPGRNKVPAGGPAIKARLKVMSLKASLLDGRRFSLVNAKAINRATQIAS